MLEKHTQQIGLLDAHPMVYFDLVDIVKSVDEKQVERIHQITKKIKKEIDLLSIKVDVIVESYNNFSVEERTYTKRRKQSVLETGDEGPNLKSDLNYITVLKESSYAILEMYKGLHSLVKATIPPKVLSPGKRPNFETYEGFKMGLQEIQFNGRLVEGFMNALYSVGIGQSKVKQSAEGIYKLSEAYYMLLVRRHGAEHGIKIYKHAVATDVGIQVFENIDGNGEVDRGTDKVSAYTLRKAQILAAALKDDMINSFVSDPTNFVNFVTDSVFQLSSIMEETEVVLMPQLEKVKLMVDFPDRKPFDVRVFKMRMNEINPANVSFVESNKIKSDTNRMMDDAREKTISMTVDKIMDKNVDFKSVVDFVLSRKAELKKFFQDENSFYVCKIGEGNQFTGTAPGALYVVPAERPTADMKWILGSGFDEIKDFFKSIESSSKWHDLFVATSPSKTADKSNVLLIGPQGCGKTEVLRSVGADKASIGVFAQGSDFFTAWAGEAEKNPKRMFEEGLKLSRDSGGKQVHFLIDEIDYLLNSGGRQEGNAFNLTLEFQVLMDGVVRYPNLSVWGATNNPHKIPMPMIRRFNKVLIVGELSHDDRRKLLRHFIAHMPISDIRESAWDEWSHMLEGSTGDVVRKVADRLWRQKMNEFVVKNPQGAEEVLNKLKENGKFNVESFDRKMFNSALRHHVLVTASDIDRSVRESLENFAIRSEIETAKKTYAAAKDLVYNKIHAETI